MATYKEVMRPALEYALSIWSPVSSLTSINKLQVIQNAALRTDTGCIQDTHIQHLHDETFILPIHTHLLLHTSQYKQKTQHPPHPLHIHTAYFNTSVHKNTTIFNNVAPLPNPEQINHPSSNHTYTKATPNHIHHDYVHSVTLPHTTHIISLTAHTYAPRCHSWICGQTPLDRRNCQMDGKAGWWTTSGKIRPPPPTNKGQGNA